MEPSKSKAFVFLPGTLCDERLWHYQTAQFPRSVVVNLRTQSSVDEMLKDIRAVGLESFILVGFSLGGYVAQEFALSDPKRVEHLVLIGSSAGKYPFHEREVALSAIPFIEKGLFKGITEKRLREFLHPDSYARPELRELIHSMSGSDAGEVYLRQLRATLDRPDLFLKLKTLKCGLTAIAGREDKIVSVEEILKLEEIKDARVHVLNHCGHFSPLEKPSEVNAILELLA
jgi:pimeloyl-ACP methyl ester carboxylesterase